MIIKCRAALLASVVTLMATGCGSDNSFTGENKPYQGYWLAQSHGAAIRVIGRAFFHYEFTKDYCFESHLEELSEQERNEAYWVEEETLRRAVYPGLEENRNDYAVVYEKAESLPSVCESELIQKTSPEASDPEVNLRMFVQTFDQYYYDLGNAARDWNTVKNTALSNVHPGTTHDELLNIMGEVIQPLGNGHVFVADGSNIAHFPNQDKLSLIRRLQKEFYQLNDLSPPLSSVEQFALNDYVNTQLDAVQMAVASYLDAERIYAAAKDNIRWGFIGDIGYLNISGFNDYLDSGDHSDTLGLMRSTMDEVLVDFENTAGLVIDLRFNGGGYAYLARALAQYFVSERTLGYTKSARYGDDFSLPVSVYLQPERNHYDRPIVLLISNTTSSAAELAAMMLASQPNVTVMGEDTQGMLSGSLHRTLPNGFVFGISNMQQLSSAGESFEYDGVPPDVATEFFPIEDRLTYTDRGLAHAIAWLESTN